MTSQKLNNRCGRSIRLCVASWLLSFQVPLVGHTPSTAGTFRKKFRKNSGKTPETLSERFLEFPSRVRLGCPKPYNSRHLRFPERFQNSLPPSTAGNASFFRIGSGEGLSELVMEFPAVLGVFLIRLGRREKTPTPRTRFSIWTLLRTPGRFTTRPLPVYFTTKMSVVGPFSVLSKDGTGP